MNLDPVTTPAAADPTKCNCLITTYDLDRNALPWRNVDLSFENASG